MSGLVVACAAPGASRVQDDCMDAVSEQLCEQIALAAEDKSGTPAVQGLLVDRVGNLTRFKVPMGYTHGPEYDHLLAQTIERFAEAMGEVHTKLAERDLDLGIGERRNEFNRRYIEALSASLELDVDGAMQDALGEAYARPRQLSTWQRYLKPQAFIGYLGTKFSGNFIVGGGVSATLMIVVQPWLVLEVDHSLPEPTVVSKTSEIDVAILGVPNVDIGGGIGGGVPLRFGGGAVFGPMDRPNDLEGWGLGVSGSLGVPVIGGNTKFIGVLRWPPLFFAQVGFSIGLAAEAGLHGNGQRIMDLDSFLDWLATWFEDAPTPGAQPAPEPEPQPQP